MTKTFRPMQNYQLKLNIEDDDDEHDYDDDELNDDVEPTYGKRDSLPLRLKD